MGIGPLPTGFGIEAQLDIHLPGMDHQEAEALVQKRTLFAPTQTQPAATSTLA